MRHVLTKVIGLREDMEPSVGTSPFSSGDTLLLCSDGLHGVVNDETIAAMLRRTESVELIASELVEQALSSGCGQHHCRGRPQALASLPSSGFANIRNLRTMKCRVCSLVAVSVVVAGCSRRARRGGRGGAAPSIRACRGRDALCHAPPRRVSR